MKKVTCQSAVIAVSKRFRAGTMIRMEDLLKSVHSYFHIRLIFDTPTDLSIQRRIRESGCFEHLNKNHPDNVNHVVGLYRRK